jgi:hypothetical protein
MNYQILKNIINEELQRFSNISEEEWSAKIFLKNGPKKKF